MRTPILVGFLVASCLWGQDAPDRVGRLGYIYGEVSLRPSGAEELVPAGTNEPLSGGDRLHTGPDSQAEVHVAATVVHLAPQTDFAIVAVDTRAFRMGLSRGALNIRIPRLNEGELVEVQTPHGTFRLLGVGTYRVDMLPESGFASITVRSGAAEAIAAGVKYPVAAGQRLVLTGDPSVAETMEATAEDAWDEWCDSRDELRERSLEASEQYVSWEVPGAEELAQYGDWEADETYGVCWRPRTLPVGWAPFRYGHWIFKLPWGWTWVDDAPWGFAPTHYGGWARVRGGLVWIPGRRQQRPAYSPARVAFSSTRNSPHVSWIPLAPGESANSRTHRNRGDVTAAPVTAFAKSKPIGAARVAIFDRGATVFSERTADVTPVRETTRGPVPRPVRVEAQPAQLESLRGVMSRPAPAESRRIERQPREADDDQRRADENQRREILQRQTDELRQANEEHRAEESRRAEDNRRAEEGRRADEARRAEDHRRAEEGRRQQEEQRRSEESRRADENRRAEEGRRADEARRAEDHRRAEESRRQQEEQRRSEESRRADENRRAEESRRADEARRAEDHRRAEEGRRQQDEQRRADETRRADEDRRNAEARKK